MRRYRRVALSEADGTFRPNSTSNRFLLTWGKRVCVCVCVCVSVCVCVFVCVLCVYFQHCSQSSFSYHLKHRLCVSCLTASPFLVSISPSLSLSLTHTHTHTQQTHTHTQPHTHSQPYTQTHTQQHT